MREIKNESYKGTRILVGNEKRYSLERCVAKLRLKSFTEIQIPVIQFQSTFESKVGEENNNLMFNFSDRKDRKLCLSPEYTSIIQLLSKKEYKYNKDVKLFYIQQCFRGERPQKGRYREFTQLGVEIINPTEDYTHELSNLAVELCHTLNKDLIYTLNTKVTRGLDYYEEGKGFELTCNSLGSSKQVCGGGSYEGGIGFAIGVDRLI